MPRNITTVNTGRLLLRDLENNDEDDFPAAKKPKSEKFSLNCCEFSAAVAVFFVFATGLTMLASEFGRKLTHRLRSSPP
ncbi:hypothetical protein HN51_049114 [Arachis hypogaea]|nr:putative membrane protein [Arachis hypogaea]